ncbi:MAG: GNAT family N-acetyltransferase [Candidatus Bipolaricaulota bacterium]|nr:GNAT family N-acetyltransferase [Candidatus Bipolaricaulota bacterium]
MDCNLDRAVSARSPSSRLYETGADLQQMYGLLMEARLRTNDWRYWHVGELAFTFFMIDCHLDPRRHVRLWHDGDKLVGYATLNDDPFFDWQVLPEYEGKGVEAEALAWAEALVAELRGEDAERWKGPMVVGTRQDNAERIAFLEQHGFQRREYVEVNMLRSLSEEALPREALPPLALPSGFHVRSLAGDASEVSDRAAAHREVWHPWTVGDVTNEQYARFMRMPGYDRDLDVVAVAPDGTIAAYVNGWLDPVNKIGDFGPVGAREAYRRQGLTRAVLFECLRRMKARGMDRVCVSTGEGNVAARGLYESVGFRIVNRYVEYARTS